MIIEELRSIARATDMPFGYGNSTRMREFFADGGGIFCLYVPFGGIPGQETWQAFVRGAGAAEAVKMIEDGMRRGGSLNITRTADGYRVDISRSIRVPFGSGGPAVVPVVTADYLYFEAVDAGAVLMAVLLNDDTKFTDMNYSTDGGATWTAWNKTYDSDHNAYVYDSITLGAVGDKVWFKGVNNAVTDGGGTFSFFFVTASGNVNAGGSVTSILDGNGATLTAIPDYGLKGLFNTDTGLLTPPTFGNATSIGVEGCHSMYNGCDLLTTAMDMGNITTFGQDACEQMYQGCSSLTLVDDGALTFAFPTLPVTAGTDTFSTPAQVETWMTT